MSKRLNAKEIQAFLDLGGETYFLDTDGHFWVKFRVTAVEKSQAKPHGLDYSLTLHDRNGERLVGFDNAHPIHTRTGSGGKRVVPNDHRHTPKTARRYEFKDTSTLLEDFWKAVDRVLKEKGV